MTVKEFKKKWNLRQARGCDVEEWENLQSGILVSPCPVGFVVRLLTPGKLLKGYMRGAGRARCAKTLDAANDVIAKLLQHPKFPKAVKW